MSSMMNTMTTQLYVRMNFVEGALIRLLGLVGRRGFDITKVDARRTDGGRCYEINLDLSGPRSVVTLQRQIAKLYDVQAVEIVPALYDTPPLRIVTDASAPPVQPPLPLPLAV